MAQNSLLEDTVPALEDMDADLTTLDEEGDYDTDLDGLTSEVDNWDDEGDYDAYKADRDYLYGLLR